MRHYRNYYVFNDYTPDEFAQMMSRSNCVVRYHHPQFEIYWEEPFMCDDERDCATIPHRFVDGFWEFCTLHYPNAAAKLTAAMLGGK
jgi:hypothetical protein